MTLQEEKRWKIIRGDNPLIATAIHDGHAARPDVQSLFALNEEGRLREEDPYTGELAEVATTQVVVHHSRFEVDLNRSREKAVYRIPEDAWGLEVWKDDLPEDIVQQSLATYDAFNSAVFDLLDEWVARYGNVVVYDLHSYNHRRNGPEGEAADSLGNPEVNVGTGTLNRERFGGVVERFIRDLRSADYLGRDLDVRENVKFKGGDFSRRIHERYPNSVCVLAIEFKKIFMDEWSGEVDRGALEGLKSCLASTVTGVLEEVRRVKSL
ncbi:MAG: N-formylglutamate amidohydrolase [Ignavibacteriae bacterium]|nr:N-formylglutamate amidohydrolase [Ignavibacteriota bacterium]MCB9214847.1 N-formylglutamate amidohydrolase [Ignavibacteria bacterium]